MLNNILPPDITSFLDSSTFYNFVGILRVVFFVLSLIFLAVIIFVLMKSTWLRRLVLWDTQEILTYKPFGVRKIVKQWQKIKARLDTGMESEYKLAVIEADSMLNDILKRMGFGGESLGDRLTKITAATLANLDEVAEVHKTRNNIVHDPDYKLVLDETKKIISTYEDALNNLQAL